jgi:hypothetical protein
LNVNIENLHSMCCADLRFAYVSEPQLVIRGRTHAKTMAKKTVEKLGQVITAWSTLAPTKTFGGYTLEQFKAKVKPSLDIREQIAVLESQMLDAITQRDDSDAVSNEAMLLVVNAVKGDPEHGENGALYSAMGYIRKSERQSGLARKAQSETTPPVVLAKAA